MELISKGLKRDAALPITGISKHQYYHNPSVLKRGRKASLTTFLIQDNQTVEVPNSHVIEAIKGQLADKDTKYGYIKMTYALKALGFHINKKKVYGLMARHQLLHDPLPKGVKNYVKYRRVMPSEPLTLLEMDIKMVWLEEYRKHAYILTIIDTFTRVVLYHIVLYSIKKQEIKEAWDSVIINHLQPSDCLNRKLEIEVRNDNDKRFSAKIIQEYFKENDLNQVFTHPYTPQENGHIESFHKILADHLKHRNFWSIEELKQDLVLFYEKYNNLRIHASICYLAPNIFWELYRQDLVTSYCDIKKRRLKFKLKIDHKNIQRKIDELLGNESRREGLSQKETSQRDTINNKKGASKEAPT